jgi:hypothetical protein
VATTMTCRHLAYVYHQTFHEMKSWCWCSVAANGAGGTATRSNHALSAFAATRSTPRASEGETSMLELLPLGMLMWMVV